MKNWQKEAVIYQIYPRSFQDSNGDGIGDLAGIHFRLDYLKSLGVDVLWLSPIYASPNDDNGYDISDYRSIHPEFGTMEDFEELLAAVHARGMKLVMDLVVNHSSDEHFWFQQARKSTDNPYRDYYIWRKQPLNWPSFFGGSAWEYNSATDDYYLHLFSKKQPDLNWENPKLRNEIYDMMRFWLDKGVNGFRMDVIPFISKRYPLVDVPDLPFNTIVDECYANGPRIHEFLQEMHREVLQQYDVLTIAEGIGISPPQGNLYVGKDRHELGMLFHFGHMFIDHGTGGKFDIAPVDLPKFKAVFADWETAIGDEGWINIYLDNHDFPRMVSRFAEDGVYRVPSAKLLAICVLTQRGTPCIYQGSEIGMTNVRFPQMGDYRDIETVNEITKWQEEGKDMDELLCLIHHQGRDNARTPMQWSAEMHAGFTNGTPWIKANPNHLRINALEATRNKDSIFHFYRTVLALREAEPALVYAKTRYLLLDDPHWMAYERNGDERFLVVLNFSSEELNFPLTEKYEGAQFVLGNYDGGLSLWTTFLPWEGRIYHLPSGKDASND